MYQSLKLTALELLQPQQLLILQIAGWTNSTTFARFYNRSESVLFSEEAQCRFSQAVLTNK